MSNAPRPFLELSIVRLRTAKTNDQGQVIESGSTGTIVNVYPIEPEAEPVYIVEFKGRPTQANLVDARHGELLLVKPDISPSRSPVLSGILFAAACLNAVAVGFSIDYCADTIRMGSGWGAVAFVYFIAPFMVILPLVLIVIPSTILFKRRRGRLDLASLLLSSTSIVVTLVEVAILMTREFRGC